MRLYKVKLNAWASPVYVQASSKMKAKELALQNYSTCDCCGAPTFVESVDEYKGVTPFFTKIIMEVKR